MQAQQTHSRTTQQFHTIPINPCTSTVLACVSQRPQWIDKQSKQLVILVRDASGSMSGEKAKQATHAGSDLVGELAGPVNKDRFHCGVIDFASKAVITHPPIAAAELVEHIKPIRTGGSTNIRHALKVVRKMIRSHGGDEQDRWHPPVVVLFSDGEVTSGGDPIPLADEIKQAGVVIVTVAYGKDADLEMLRAIASSPQHCYRRSASGDELRRFMASVGRTLTMTMATGQNASQTLMNL
jgi:Mg-chelatase subunit ChlD